MKKKLVVLSGAGMSAESGLKTFRDADGLWEGYRIEEVATLEAFQRNPSLVLDFYNERRKQLLTVEPNRAHQLLVILESYFNVQVVTQNVDDLHERAGSAQVLHLHGELLKARSSVKRNLIYPWHKDIVLGDCCELGFQLRPHIVWFGEDVPLIQEAAKHVESADILLIIGTSLQVYPAAGLMHYAPHSCKIFYIDPKPSVQGLNQNGKNVTTIPEKAIRGMELLMPVLSQMG